MIVELEASAVVHEDGPGTRLVHRDGSGLRLVEEGEDHIADADRGHRCAAFAATGPAAR